MRRGKWMKDTDSYRGTVVRADIDLDRFLASTGNSVCCMLSLRKRVYSATTGSGRSALVLAVTAVLGGVTVPFASELFQVDCEKINNVLEVVANGEVSGL